MPGPARVLIVDDSRIFRAALAEALTGQEGIVVVGSVFSGEKALEFLRASPVDVVTLDVEMPGLDGLQTLAAIQRLNASRPLEAEIGVIMVSAFTSRGADVTVRALQAGAFDFVTKPSSARAESNLAELRRQLTCQIRLFLARRSVADAAQVERVQAPGRLRPARSAHVARPVRAVLIASSTGGPRALDALLPDLRRRVELPVLIVQHMPPRFTQSLAESLARRVGGRVVEAADGDHVQSGTVYIAPGGRHLVLRSQGGRVLTGLNDQPPENHCRPSADVLFRSAAAALGGEAVAVVLTGMDCDGTAGLRPLKRAGAYVIAQDEATSVVWGMPGSVVRAGLADEVLPLGDIAAAVQALVGGQGAH
ncbi:MAG TPA: chemotaxis-specific protein-glutamate methyltransferase CheB [Gemmataceae bacterium]|nr:chemotaxis-specific protein-glutamate methyltransferase CheB [Gemmataceae bacterium]